MRAIISALGTGIQEEFDLDKLRYHKVVLMADADVDGHHINTLLLTLLFRFMKPLIEGAIVYMASRRSSGCGGTNPRARVRLGSDAERDALMRDGQAGKKLPKREPGPATRAWVR